MNTSIHGLRRGKCLALALGRTMRANGAPVVRRGCEGKAAGWRAGSAPVRCMFMDEHSANTVAPSRTRRAGGPESAPPGSPFFCLLFFGEAKKSESLAAGERKPCSQL